MSILKVSSHLPERDTQTPDRLRLQARGLRHAHPSTVVDLAPVLVDTVPQRHGEVVRGAHVVRGADGLAVEVRERLADGDGDDDQSDEQQAIDDGGDEEREDVVEEEDECDNAVDDCYACL